MRFAIFDNLANNAYIQAKAFHRRGHPIDLVLDPLDAFVMSDPRWEDLDLELDPAALTTAHLPPWPDEPAWIRRGPSPPPGRRQAMLAVAAGAARSPRTAVRAARTAGLRAAVIASAQRWAVETLREYDAVVAYGLGSIYAALAGVPFLAQTWGGDITVFPFADAPPGQRGETPEPGQSRSQVPGRDVAIARLLRSSLRRADQVLLTDPRFFPFAERLGFASRARFVPFAVDTDKYAPGAEPALRAQLLGDRGEVLLFVPSRLDYHWKGSDRMLRGVAEAMGQHEGIVLACAGWGVDRDQARRDAAALGIADRVRFLPHAFSKRRLLRYYRAADIVLDQFAIGSYGSSALEAMSVGRPLLIHLDPARFDRVFGLPPVVNVHAPGEIAAALARLAVDPAERERVGRAQRDWVIRHQGDHLADEVQDLLVAAVRRRANGSR